MSDFANKVLRQQKGPGLAKYCLTSRSKLTLYLEIDDKVLEVRIFDDSLLTDNILNSFTQVAPLIVASQISEIIPHCQLSAKDKLGVKSATDGHSCQVKYGFLKSEVFHLGWSLSKVVAFLLLLSKRK